MKKIPARIILPKELQDAKKRLKADNAIRERLWKPLRRLNPIRDNLRWCACMSGWWWRGRPKI